MLRFLNRLVISASHVLNWVAASLVAAMAFLTTLDVIGRYLGYPVRGTYDIIGLSLVIIVSLPIAYTQILKGHVSVDFLLVMAPKQPQKIIVFITKLLSLGLFILIMWQSCVLGTFYLKSWKVSMTEHIPLFPFVYAIGLGCLPVCLILLIDLIKSLAGESGNEPH